MTHSAPRRPARRDTSAAALYATIRVGSRVTIRTPHDQTRTGRATLRGPAGWVLNLGGRYGTPGIACPANLVAVGRTAVA